MARKCKCNICKKELTTDNSYKVTTEKRNYYYCNENEYINYCKDQEAKQSCINGIQKILNIKLLPPFIIKQLNELHLFYDYNTIKKTFEINSSKIDIFLQKNDWKIDFPRSKYIFTIIKNEINIVEKQLKEQNISIKNKVEVDIEVINVIEETVKYKNVMNISEWL